MQIVRHDSYPPPKTVYEMEEGESEEDPVSITDEDLRTLEVPKLRTFVWNSQHGFALQWPLELQKIRENEMGSPVHSSLNSAKDAMRTGAGVRTGS